jgi:hypothetical protein
MFAVRLASVVFALSFLCGCAFQRDAEGPVSDPDFNWVRTGFSVKAPAAGRWYKLPASERNPNSVHFQRGEGLYYAEFNARNTIYLKGSLASADSTILREPVKNRNDKEQLTRALQDHLERYLFSMRQQLEGAEYDNSLGADCLRYEAASTQKRIATEAGQMHMAGIRGYLCLHPTVDDFAVIMQTSNYAMAWNDISRTAKRSSFFKSLRFLPISSSVSRRLAHYDPKIVRQGEIPKKPASKKKALETEDADE